MSAEGGPEQEAPPLPEAAPLPEAVRSLVNALAAEALGRLPQAALPARLKRVATFAPQRRARLAGSQIAAALETDDSFRNALAAEVRTAQPQLAEAVETGSPPPAADPAEVAALAFLLRPEGWHSIVAAAAHEVAASQAVTVEERHGEDIERLRKQLDAAVGDLKSARQRHRAEAEQLKSQNAELRRKLGETRARLKTAEAAAAGANDTIAEISRRAATATNAAEAEARRLRARVEELEAALGQQRRADRAERDIEELRTRLLLDTLLESAQGLRRELALPAAEASPADLVEAKLAQEGAERSPGDASLALDDPARLDQMLRLPRVHLIIDGYNVTMNAWPEYPLEKQRDRLVGDVATLAARTAAEVTIVFDAADRQQRPSVHRPRGVRVLYSPVGVIADDVIRDLVSADPRGRPLVVVTDDQALTRDVTRAGARSARAAALIQLVSRA